MKCSSMVCIAAFGPGDPGSNPGWFSVLNSNRKLSYKYMNNTRLVYCSSAFLCQHVWFLAGVPSQLSHGVGMVVC